MSFWSELSHEQLRHVLQCNDVLKVFEYFEEGEGKDYLVEKEIKYDRTVITKSIRKIYKPALKKANISYPLFGVITDSPSTFIMMLASLLDGASLIFLSVSVLTGVLAGALVLAGIAYSVLTYLEVRNARRKDKQFFDLMQIQLECAQVLLEKQGKRPAPVAKFKFNNDSVPTFLKTSLNISLFSAFVLFGTYYLTTAAVLSALGLVAISGAMTSGIGLGVALAVALIIGFAIGYKQYQISKNSKRRSDYKAHLLNQVHSKIGECNKSPSIQNRLNEQAEIHPPMRTPSQQLLMYDSQVPETYGADSSTGNQYKMMSKHGAAITTNNAGSSANSNMPMTDNSINGDGSHSRVKLN